MTPAVSAHVHSALKPYLLHFNYTIPDNLATPGHTVSPDSTVPARLMPTLSLAAAGSIPTPLMAGHADSVSGPTPSKSRKYSRNKRSGK
jgi:hypothetical protein